jgi:hypothetical protein
MKPPEEITAQPPPRASEEITDRPPAPRPSLPPARGKGGLRPRHWIAALVALAVLVFVVTLVMNFAPDSSPPRDPGGKDGGPGPGGVLTFAYTRYPPEVEPGVAAPPLDEEYGRDGGHDFWFRNDNDRPIPVMLIGTNCTCAGVEVSVMPPEWLQRWRALSEACLKLDGVWPIPRKWWDRWTGPYSPSAVPSSGDDPELLALEAAVKPTKLEKDQTKATLEPGAVGKFRLLWAGKSGKPNGQGTTLKGTLRLGEGEPRLTPMQELEVRLSYREPIQVRSTEIDVGSLAAGQGARTYWFTVWSSTRASPDLRVRMVHNPNEVVQVGKPVPLSAEQCQELEKELADRGVGGRVKAAYRVPVEIGQEKGNVKLEIGTFRRRVEVSVEGAREDPLYVAVSGAVRGDVRVDPSGPINFRSVKKSSGSNTEKLRLQAETPGLNLEVDRKRTKRFLEVELKALKEEDVGGGKKRTWELTVRLPPGSPTGAFPKDDDELFRDSAVYLRMTRSDQPTGPEEYLRIPVLGIVSDG